MENNLRNFEDFIYACEGLLFNAQFDLIKWDDNMIRDLWEKSSFFSTNKMPHAEKAWFENKGSFYDNSHKLKSHLKHLILVGKNPEVKQHVKSELKKTFNEFESFWKKYELNHVKALAYNQWFWDAFGELTCLIQWFENTFNEQIILKETVDEIQLKSQNQTMFAISKTKSKFRLKNGNIQQRLHTTKESFDLDNFNVYDVESEKIVQVGTQRDYNSSFMIDLENLYILHVKPFLQHHWESSLNKSDFLDYVKYAVPHSNIVQGKGKLQAVHDWVESIENKALLRQPINTETNTGKYYAKHYLLAYLFECNAKGESFPIGNKKKLEGIGNERMGAGKGNRFYKVFNEIINKDLNAENNLFEIGGEYWRKAVIELSKAPELVEKYLQSKQL